MTLHQVEFLVEGNLLPLTIGKLCISENLILEKVWREGLEFRLSHEPTDYAIAYVGVDTPEKGNPFPAALDNLDFFLLIYSLVSGQPVTRTMGVGTTLDDITSLGSKRVGFSSFEKITVLHSHITDKGVMLK